MKLLSSLPLRKMGADYVVYRVDSKTKERSMIVLNDTAAFLWKKFVQVDEFTCKDLVDALMEEYEIDEKTASDDVASLVNSWVESGFALN